MSEADFHKICFQHEKDDGMLYQCIPSQKALNILIRQGITCSLSSFSQQADSSKIFVLPLAKNFQEDQLNSKRFPVFSGGVDTLLKGCRNFFF